MAETPELSSGLLLNRPRTRELDSGERGSRAGPLLYLISVTARYQRASPIEPGEARAPRKETTAEKETTAAAAAGERVAFRASARVHTRPRVHAATYALGADVFTSE